MTNRAFGWSASMYQSVSTTPGVALEDGQSSSASHGARPRRSVNFGDERLQHRRPGRHFGDRDARAKRFAMAATRGRMRFGDVVALRLALVLGHEIHLDVRHVRAAPHEVMPHESVEIERRRHAPRRSDNPSPRVRCARRRRFRARLGRCVPARCPRACSG
jgi:hypothetical protein